MDINRAVVIWFRDVFSGHVLIDALVVFLAEYLPYFLLVGLFYYVFMINGWRRRWIFILLFAFILIISLGAIAWPLQAIVGSDRPYEVLGFETFIFASGAYSFPSLHATFFAALSVLLFLIDRKWGLWYGFITIFIGVGRVAAGVHWPVDVVAGFFVGIVGALLGSYLSSNAFYSLRSRTNKAQSGK